jgi:rare lipoprotein A
LKRFICILLCFSGLINYSQNKSKESVLKNPISQDTLKKYILKSKTHFKHKSDSLAKLSPEISFSDIQPLDSLSQAYTKPFKENVVASYYADKFHGRKTASGAKYDNKKLTAAHRTLPFGTVLKVTNLSNGKSVLVTVNDRGPFSKGKEIDLSKAAFIEIAENFRHGTIRVTIEIVEQL